jgi:hypothetical protein
VPSSRRAFLRLTGGPHTGTITLDGTRVKVKAAAAVAGAELLTTHVADYRRQYDRMTIDLGRRPADIRSGCRPVVPTPTRRLTDSLSAVGARRDRLQ